MGLFDKLREVADVAKETLDKATDVAKVTLDKAVDTALISSDPAVEKYRNQITALLSTVDRLTKENIKTYYKVVYDEVCDDAALDRALSKFEANVERICGETWYRLTFNQLQKSYNHPTNLDRDKIYDICFADFKQEVKNKFNEILDILGEHQKIEYFKDGINKLYRELNCPIDLGYPQERLRAQVMGQMIVERLLANDSFIQKMFVQELLEYLCKYKGIERAYALVLRANQFKKFSGDLENYQSISKKEC